MWFWFALVALLCWSGSDLFSKIGLHAAYEIFVGGVTINGEVILKYLPVSMLYIVSMTVGYVGLRYIELSISSPICNSSGAIVAVLIFATQGINGLPPMALVAVGLVCLGIIALGFTEANEDEELRRARQDASNHHYTRSWIAIALPIIYCLLDALGSFADSRVLETLNEDSANVAYELTFLTVGIVCAIYVLGVKKQRLIPKREVPKYTGAIFETAGQFAYIYARADTAHAALAAPMISAYCVASVVWSRIFLKEKLSVKHYASILLVVAGIVILGILDI